MSQFLIGTIDTLVELLKFNDSEVSIPHRYNRHISEVVESTKILGLSQFLIGTIDT